MQTFDLILIGTGAGLTVSSAASAQGMKVAVVEEGPFGGTCVNRGCIPSKMLIRSADVRELVLRAHAWGIDAEVKSIDWQKIVGDVAETVDGYAADSERATRADPNVTVFQGHGRFTGEKRLEVNGEELTAPNIVIAAGGRPRIPDLPGLQGTPYLTSDNAMRIREQPRRMVIVGAGSVGVELAHFFGDLGTEITIVQRRDKLLASEDADIADGFTEVYSQKFNVLCKANLTKVEYEAGLFRMQVQHGESTQTLEAEALLIATGRVPNSDTLNVAAAGIGIDERGFIETDDYLETRVPGIWALGDIAGHFMLRHNSNLEASYVAHNLLNHDRRVQADHYGMPHAVFGSPQVGSVGLTEDQAREAGRKIKVGRADYMDVTYGISLQDADGFVKVIADAETREILGCHILGTDASVLIQEAANAMRMRLKTDAISQSIYVHPALPEVVSKAFVNAE